jgi:acetolactate synthase I/II/III large subunit
VNTETVAEAVADELAQLGVDRVFGLPGGEVLALIDALRRRGLEYALCRHEADAGMTAAVYGKLKGTVGVVLTTLGPGAANLMLPLSNSLLDREPLLALSAQTPESWSWDRTHQKVPLLEAYRPVTKYAAEITPWAARGVVSAAAAAALGEPQGPAFLTLSAEHSRSPLQEGPPARPATPAPGPNGTAAQAAADELRERLAAAERPLVVVGLGTRAGTSGPLRRWLAAWGLPVAVTPKVKGIVDERDPRFFGVVGGMALDAVMRDGLAAADLVIGFGLDPVEIDGAWHSELPVLWTLESAWATGAAPARDVLAADHLALLAALGDTPPRTWDDAFADVRARRAEIAADGAGNGRLSPVAAVRALAEALPPETIVTTDVGSHKYVVGQFWPSRDPATFFMSNGLSGMGYGLPAAIGAKLARADAPVLAVVGDGGFSMNSQELETARRLGAAVIVVVLADNSYSMIQLAQESRGMERYGVDFDPIDTVATARACGVRAVRVESGEALAEAAAGALAAGEPLVIEVPIAAADYKGIV